MTAEQATRHRCYHNTDVFHVSIHPLSHHTLREPCENKPWGVFPRYAAAVPETW